MRPNNLSHTTDFHMFRDGIKPIWEDPMNKRGKVDYSPPEGLRNRVLGKSCALYYW